MPSPRPPPSSPTQHHDAQSLRSFLLSCPNDILAVCSAVESLLLHQTPEATVDFFRLCFPLLLQRIFGFQESAPLGGWLCEVSATRNEAAGRALLSLLSPTGALFSALLALDREDAVQFLFPNERLPHWVRRLLALERGAFVLSQISELFKNRMQVDANGAVHLQLDLFEYYMFWFAYYAVCQDNGFGQGLSFTKRTRSASKPSQIRSLGQWVSSLQHPFHFGNSASRHDLYLQLLHLYLLHFVQASHITCNRLHVVQVPNGTDISHGHFLLLTLVEFWLKNDDPGPLPASMHQSLGLSQFGGIGVGSFPPATELCDGLRLVINHANSLLMASLEQPSRYNSEGLMIFNKGLSIHSYVGTSVLFSSHPVSADADFTLDRQLLQRPLYRFICCAFVFWPTGTPVRQACHLMNVWLDYLQPWNSHLEGKSATPAEPRYSEDRASTELYSARWQGYVTRNYYFYTSLVVHFLGFALKFIRADPEAVLEMTAKVLSVLAGSKDLLELMKRIDCSYHGTLSGGVDHTDSSSLKMDCEESSTFGNPVGQDLINSLVFQQSAQPCLFDTGENGAFQVFQMLILQAEVEIQFMMVETRRAISKALEVIKDAGSKIFDSHPVYTPTDLHSENQQIIPEENMSRALGRHTSFDVKYRGDWMRRPIESTEVAWLARLLVKLSDSINKKLDLVACENYQEQDAKASCEVGPQMAAFLPEITEFNFREIFHPSRNPSVNMRFLDIVQAIKTFLYKCWLVLCSHVRQQGWRVNLRFMAKKPALLFLLLSLLWLLRKI